MAGLPHCFPPGKTLQSIVPQSYLKPARHDQRRSIEEHVTGRRCATPPVMARRGAARA